MLKVTSNVNLYFVTHQVSESNKGFCIKITFNINFNLNIFKIHYKNNLKNKKSL